MSRRAGPSRAQPPPTGQAFQNPGHEPVANAQARLLTAYRADLAWGPQYPTDRPFLQDVQPGITLEVSQPDITLRGDYEEAIERVAHTDREYQRQLRLLLQSFPQGADEVPARPTPEEMQVLFKKVLYHEQTRPRGKGSKGGVKHYECEWPACPFKGALQKCMDHFFSEHVKLKFFKCEKLDCGIAFLRKYDLDKHKKKQHALLRPRDIVSQSDRGVARTVRRTRSGGPYPMQGRSTRGRPAGGPIPSVVNKPVLQSAQRDPAQPKHQALKNNSLSSSETSLLDGHDSKKGERTGRLGQLDSVKLGSLTTLPIPVLKPSSIIGGGDQTPPGVEVVEWGFLIVRSLKGSSEGPSLSDLLYVTGALINGTIEILFEEKKSGWHTCLKSLESHKTLIAAMEARLANCLGKHTRMVHREFVGYVDTLWYRFYGDRADRRFNASSGGPFGPHILDIIHVISAFNLREVTELLHESGYALAEPPSHEMATNISWSMMPVNQLSDGEQWYRAGKLHMERSRPVSDVLGSVFDTPHSLNQLDIGAILDADHPGHSLAIVDPSKAETIARKVALDRHRSFIEQLQLEYQRKNGPGDNTVSAARIGDGPVGASEEVAGRKGRHHVQLVPLNFELPQTYTWVDEDSTYCGIGLLVYSLKPTTLPVALEQKDGPYPRWQIPDRAAKIPRHLYQVYIADVTNPFTVALVRNPERDTPILIPISSTILDKSPTVRDVFGPVLIEKGVQWNAITLLWDPHDIQRSPYHLIQQEIGEFCDANILVLCNSDTSEYKFCSVLQNPVPMPLKAAFLQCRALVQSAPRLKTLSLPTIHLCRALLHLIASAAKAIALSNLHIGVASFFISRLESLIETMQAILAGLADMRYQSEGFASLKKLALAAFFHNLCSELPGAVAVRRSFESFTAMMNYRHHRRVNEEADPYFDEMVDTRQHFDDETGSLSESDGDSDPTEALPPSVMISGFRSPSESSLSSSNGGDDYSFPRLGHPPVAAAGSPTYSDMADEPPTPTISSSDDMELDPLAGQPPLGPIKTEPYADDFEVLYWTSTDPSSSSLFDSDLQVIYRYTTEVDSHESNKITLWRYVNGSRNKPVARFKRSFNGSFGDAIIGEVPGNASDFLRPKEGALSPLTQCLYHDEKWYEWEFRRSGECILRDTGGNAMAILCAVQPQRCQLGVVYSELRFAFHIAMMTVPLKDAICISAMLYRCFLHWDVLSRSAPDPATA